MNRASRNVPPEEPAAGRLALRTFTKFMRAHSALTSRLLPTIAGHGLTPTQFGILEALHHLGPMNQQIIASKLLVSKGNITMVISNLVREGLVARRRVSGDRRQKLIVITAKGTRRMQRVFPDVARAIVEELSVLSAAQQEQLGALCRRLGQGRDRGHR